MSQKEHPSFRPQAVPQADRWPKAQAAPPGNRPQAVPHMGRRPPCDRRIVARRMRPQAGIGKTAESHMELGCRESHMELGCRGKPRETARSSGVGKACGNESPGGATIGISRGASRPGLCFFPHATFVARTLCLPLSPLSLLSLLSPPCTRVCIVFVLCPVPLSAVPPHSTPCRRPSSVQRAEPLPPSST